MSRQQTLASLSEAQKGPRDLAATAAIPLLRLDWLWLYNPGSLCNLACRHCLTLSSPSSKVLQPLETFELEAALREAQELCRSGFSIGMTGGEIFLLAQKRYGARLFEQLELALSYGPVLALTNAILASEADLRALQKIASASPHGLSFRVSLDGETAEENDRIRVGVGGKPTWTDIMAALHRFVAAGFFSDHCLHLRWRRPGAS
jgi:sulfatase maturation enzyme AslB (radical SAM superfamily)